MAAAILFTQGDHFSLEAIADGKDRILLTMATGTGSNSYSLSHFLEAVPIEVELIKRTKRLKDIVPGR